MAFPGLTYPQYFSGRRSDEVEERARNVLPAADPGPPVSTDPLAEHQWQMMTAGAWAWGIGTVVLIGITVWASLQ